MISSHFIATYKCQQPTNFHGFNWVIPDAQNYKKSPTWEIKATSIDLRNTLTWETHFDLSKVRNIVESLRKRVHVTCCSLVLKSNITSLLFQVIRPVIQNLANSNLSFNDACVIDKVPSSRVIKITERHEWCETPITISCIELMLCVCKKQTWRSKIVAIFFFLIGMKV